MNLGVYLVTDPVLCRERGVVDTVRAAVAGGVRAVQLRNKTATDAEVLSQLAQIAAVVRGRALLLVNDRVDVVAQALQRGIRVDGVHLGQGDADPRVARERLGEDAVIGLTANTAAHLDTVASWPPGTLDYLGVGVIRATATKPDHPPVLGVDGFARFTARSPLPTVAIGGVALADLPALRGAGGSGVAVVSAICSASDPENATRALAAAWAAPIPPTPRG